MLLRGDRRFQWRRQHGYRSAYGTAAITIFLGDGKGNFTRNDMPLNLGPGVALKGLTTLADFNGDHIADLVATLQDTTGFWRGVVLLGLGNGSFRAPILLRPEDVRAVADFNRDGKLDLLVAHCEAGAGFCGLAVLVNGSSVSAIPCQPPDQL